jgi:LysM repeat protein
MRNHKLPCPDGYYYTIQCGDTLASIAEQNGVTVQQILEMNVFLAYQEVLVAGQRIWIPEDNEE